MAYGVAIIIISAIVHYMVIPGIENCNSMSGIVSTYTSKDYSAGCQILSNTQSGTIVVEISGLAIAVFGALQKPKIK
ncbi:MAG: hypothetical protein KGI25_08760 [Thaumarchaeota archaeon]|nr:hypothetical protein [Nitrososphaerota archaeon]